MTLTDAQVDHIKFACRPLQPSERTALLAELFELLLNHRDQIGEGELGRELRALQRKHFTPPTDEQAGVLGTRHETRSVFKRNALD